VSFQAVQKYEQGENRLSASRLWRAAQFLQRPVSFFFDEIDGTTAAGPQTTFTRDEIDLVRHFRSIASEDVRDRLVQVAKRVGEVKDEGRDATGG
jgi:transcriptional regulator with XRE-family HTH domain